MCIFVMNSSESFSPSRKRKAPAKYRDGATAGELATHCGIPQPTTPPRIAIDSGPPPPPFISLVQPLKKRGRKPKPQFSKPHVVAIVLDADTVEGVIEAAAKTADSIYEEVYKSEDSEGKLVV